MATNTPTAAPGREALEKFLPYVLSGLSAVSTAISAASHFVNLLFFKFSPLPVMFYLMAPLFVFIETLIEIFIHVPYQIIMSFLDAIYPVYVFCGVACITGGIIGLTGRIISKSLVNLLEETPVVKTEVGPGIRGARKGKAKA